MSEMLKIESAALRLGGRLLFRDFSLEVRAGEWVCVTGESGCGKTSLLRAALGFLPLEAGRVSVGGEELTEHTVERIRKRTAYVPQELFLPAESVDDMLHLPFHLKANRGGDFSEEKLFRFWTLLGLERDLLHRKVVQLSGGQRQRICIGTALMQEPKLLIADEPVSALDVTIQAQVLELLKQLKEEMGLSILFISHDLRVVYQMCNHVMIMQKGQFVEMGVPEEIYFAPKDPYTKKLLESAGIE